MANHVVSTPPHERCVTSYAARTQYKPGVVHPPHIEVKDAIDIHCHAHEGQQDPYDLARRASLAEMYNTIREVGVEHFTLSSDAGEPLFPDSVEAMRRFAATWKPSA